MRFPLLVALSHLRSRKKAAGVSAITLVSTLGVMVGVTALIMVLAVMEGFEKDLRDKILGSHAHVIVLQYGGHFEGYADAADQVAQLDGVEAAAPFVYTEVMVRSDWGSAGVVLKGIDPVRSASVTDVADNLKTGPAGPLETAEAREAVLAGLPGSQDPGADPADLASLPGIVVGEELAEQIKVYPGDKLHIINPVGGGVGAFGVPVPRVQAFRVAGIFYSGMYEYDTKWTYVSLADAQSFLQIDDAATGIEAKVHEPDDVASIADAVQGELPYPFYVRDWQTLNQSLFAALQLEKYVMGLILGLIVLVASLNIIGSLILVVVTRGREISIMRAMGASARQIRSIFMLEGLIIGVVGTVVGTALGLAGCVALDNYRFPLDTDVYYLDTLPVVVVPETVVVVAVSAVLICFLATLYPATLASRIDPVEGLRYE